MLELKNCERCGKIYHSNSFFKVCPVCFDLDEQDFLKIKEYLYDHPCAKIYEVVNALDMSVKKIKRYLRENRLEILEKDNQFLFCEMCGKPIRSGQYCDSCYKEFHHDYKVVYNGGFSRKCSNSVNYKTNTDKKPKIASSQ